MVNFPDLINCFFESFGSIFVLLSIIKLYKDKEVKGVSALTTGFFASWGVWNLFYYPHLGQWASFFGGILVATSNLVWVGMILYYNNKNKRR